MRTALLLSALAAAALAIPRPQDDLAGVDLALISQLFGTADSPRTAEEEYSGDNSGVGDAGADVVIQVVKEPTREELPSDYSESGGTGDRATVEVNSNYENCVDFAPLYQCVPYYQCHNGTIITDGTGLIDIRNGFGTLDAENSGCPGFLDVCCRDPDVEPAKPKEPLHQPKCGKRNTRGLQTRIQGFTEGESQFGEWPHMVAVLREEQPEQGGKPINLYQCGGSLIAPGVVLTAAHCVDKYRSTPRVLKVRAGEWDTQREGEPYQHQDRTIAAVRIHPEYLPGPLYNDLAVLFTESAFDLAPHVDTVCLPDLDDNFDYSQCFATGWGKDKFGADGEYQVVLKEINLPVVDNRTCQDQLRKTRLGQRFRLHPSFICAGGVAGKDTCKGDGGSPLVCPSKTSVDTYVQAGVVAWGIGCGEDGTPGVYASVSTAVCWIDYAMSGYYGAAAGGDSSSYWNYNYEKCGYWMEDTLDRLQRQIDGSSGNRQKQFIAQKSQYEEFKVTWNGDGDYVDLSVHQRVKEPLVSTTTSGSAVRFGK